MGKGSIFEKNEGGTNGLMGDFRLLIFDWRLRIGERRIRCGGMFRFLETKGETNKEICDCGMLIAA
jgi:hypothetical protein